MGQEESRGVGDSPSGGAAPLTPRRTFAKLSKRLSSNSSFNLTSSPSGSTPGTVTAATDFSFEPAPPHPSGFTTLQHPKQGAKGHEGPQEGQPRTTRSNSITTRAPEKPTRTSSSLPPEAVLANLYTQHERNEHERPTDHHTTGTSDICESDKNYNIADSDIVRTQHQKSNESVYLSTEDLSLQLFQREIYNDDGSYLQQFGSRTRPDTLDAYNDQARQMNLYDPSLDLIDLCPDFDEPFPELPRPSSKHRQSKSPQPQSTFGSSFQNRQKSFELLNCDDDYQNDTITNVSDFSQIFGSKSIFNNDYQNSAGTSLPIFGLYSTQNASQEQLNTDYSQAEKESNLLQIEDGNSSINLLEFSSSEQLDEPSETAHLTDYSPGVYDQFSNTTSDQNIETSSSNSVSNRIFGQDLELTESLIDQERVPKDFPDLDRLKSSRVASSVFSPCSSTDGIYILDSLDPLSDYQKDSPQSLRRKEIRDMRYCDQNGKSLVPKTPEDSLDPPDFGAQPYLASTEFNYDGKQSHGLSHAESFDLAAIPDFVPDFDDKLPTNLPARFLKNSEMKRKTGSLKLFEMAEEDCMNNDSSFVECQSHDQDKVSVKAEPLPAFDEYMLNKTNESQTEIQSEQTQKSNEDGFIHMTPEASDSLQTSGFATITKPRKNQPKQPSKLTLESEPLRPSGEESVPISELETKSQNDGKSTFLRPRSRKSTKPNDDSKEDSKDNSLQKTEQNQQFQTPTHANSKNTDAFPSGTFVRKKSNLKPPTSYRKSFEKEMDNENKVEELNSGNQNAENTGTFLKKPKRKNSVCSKATNDAPHRNVESKQAQKPDSLNIEAEKLSHCIKQDGRFEDESFKSKALKEQSLPLDDTTCFISGVNRCMVDMSIEAVETKCEETEEYIRTRTELKENLSSINEMLTTDVWAVEESFSELHKKYDLVKLHYPHFKSAATDAKKYLGLLLKHLESERELRHRLADQIEEQMARGKESSDKKCEGLEKKMAQLKAEIDLQKLKNSQLTDKVKQKELENSQVAKLCDEMITTLKSCKSQPSTPV